jgi:hypothetical protein
MENALRDKDLNRLWLGILLVMLAVFLLVCKTMLSVYFLEEKVFIYQSVNPIVG